MALLTFYVKQGHLYVKQGHLIYTDGSVCFAMSATSGKGVCINDPGCSGQSYIGPIPKGGYSLYAKEMDDPNVFHDIARPVRHGDWGDWRLRLYLAPGTETKGRTNLFLHCGFKRGSAGCIDVGGGVAGSKSTDRLKAFSLKSERTELYVL